MAQGNDPNEALKMVCMYVYMYVCMYVCMYVYMYVNGQFMLSLHASFLH